MKAHGLVILLCAAVLAAGTACSSARETNVRTTPVAKASPAPAPVKTAPTRMVGGSVKSVNRTSGTVTIRTPMGQSETLAINDQTEVFRKQTPSNLDDLRPGDKVKIDYQAQAAGPVLAKAIRIGYSVASCSCGSGCGCPLSRGCRVVKY